MNDGQPARHARCFNPRPAKNSFRPVLGGSLLLLVLLRILRAIADHTIGFRPVVAGLAVLSVVFIIAAVIVREAQRQRAQPQPDARG